MGQPHLGLSRAGIDPALLDLNLLLQHDKF